MNVAKLVVCSLLLGSLGPGHPATLLAAAPAEKSLSPRKGESRLQFVHRLRDAGQYKQALSYLSKLSRQTNLSKDLAAVIPLERGLVLLAQAGATLKAEERESLDAEAIKSLDAFLKSHPKHARVAEAFSARARLRRLQAEILIADLEMRLPADRKSKLRKAAREKITAARADFQAALDHYQTVLLSLPKFIPSDMALKRMQRQAAQIGLMKAMLDKASTRFHEARIFEDDSMKRNKVLYAAAEEYNAIHLRYRTQIGGLYARMWSARCYQEMNDLRRALGIYAELLSHPGKSAALRKLQNQALNFKLMCLNHLKRRDYRMVVQAAQEWLKKDSTNHKTSAGLAIRYELARAQEAIATAAKTPAEKRAEFLGRALENAQFVQKHSVVLRRKASQLIARIRAAMNQKGKEPGNQSPLNFFRYAWSRPVMICISVTPKSRKFAKVDLLNAARQCDLVELCLDHLIKEPDISDLLSAIDKPVLISCRRQSDGGHWEGSEDDRLKLLRQAIVSGPAYVELEHDVADKIRRFGDTQRVISYTSLDVPIVDVEQIYDEARSRDADVVKFSFPTRTLEATWPLLKAVTQRREPPIVGMGLGRAGQMFSLLGRKFHSPWIYAALGKRNGSLRRATDHQRSRRLVRLA